jgi:PHD/YefM family antitoxin component YafN of YafNO toxin-antitoxin module
MNVQYLSNEKGERTGVYISMKDWEKIQEELKHVDFWDELPDHVKDGIERGQKQAMAGQTKSHDEVMEKYSKYL